MSILTIDGINKVFNINFGITEFNVEDLYSEYKEWVLTNPQFLQAFRTSGGDPTTNGQSIASYYFLMNGWKIKPFEDDHRLTVTGNLFSDDGSNPFIPTIDPYNVMINLSTSNNAVVINAGVPTDIESKIDMLTLLVTELWKINGLDPSNPMFVSSTNRNVDTINQTFSNGPAGVTVIRN